MKNNPDDFTPKPASDDPRQSFTPASSSDAPQAFSGGSSLHPAPERITFDPEPLKARHDGWTPARQIAFIEALAETACVDEACRHVGMSRQTAYALRRRPHAIAFRDAWDAALDYSLHQLEQAAIGRAIHGVPRPILYKGEQVGEYRDHDERLAMFLLRYRRPARYGGWIDGEPSPQLPEDYYPPDETALRLGFHLDQIGEDESDSAPESEESPRAKGV